MNRKNHFWQGSKRALYRVLVAFGVIFGAWACTVEQTDDDDDDTRQVDRAGSSGNATGGSSGQGQSQGGSAGATDSGDAGEPTNTSGTGGRQTGGSGSIEGGAPSQAGADNDAGEAGSGGTGSGVPGAVAGSWTYLVYMLADNDLEPFALEDLEELMEVGSGGKLTILVQIDRAVGEAVGAIGGLAEFTTVKRVRVEAGSLVQLGSDLGELDLGDSATFAEFLEWGIETAPAEHYAVVLWDHGAAWPQFGADFSHSNNGLTLPELTLAFDRALTSKGLLGPFDLVGFDACLMGSWEIATALQGRARYLLGSEELEPGHGWDHQTIELLRAGAEPEVLGRELIDGYEAQAREKRTFPKVTLSLTDIGKVPALTRAIEGLTTALGDGGVSQHAAFVGRSRANAPTFGSNPGGESSEMTDLLMFVEGLAALDSSVTDEVAVVRSALAAAVVDQVRGEAFADVGGLSIYFPELQSRYLSSYNALSGVGAWRSFLTEFYRTANAVQSGPEFTNPGKVADVEVATDGLNFSGQLATGSFDNLSEVLLDTGILGSSNTLFFLAQEPAEVTTDGLVGAFWDLHALMLVEGTKEDFAYYILEQSPDNLLSLTIPLNVIEDGESIPVVLVIVFDLDGNILTQSFYAAVAGAWAEHEPALDAIIQTVIPTLGPSATQAEMVIQDTQFGGDVELQFLPIPSGVTVLARLSARDYAGNADAVIADQTLP